MSLEIRLLGPIEASNHGARLDLRGDRQRALLAFLALTPGSPRSIERIIDALWDQASIPADPRSAVHTYASRLRAALGEATVVASSGGYELTVEPQAIDAPRFEILLRRAKEPACDLEQRLATLGAAVALWRGPALEGLDEAGWARPYAVRLDEMRAEAEDLLARARLEASRPDDAIADLESAVHRYPVRESTHRLLMTALHRAGRQGDALRVFQEYRRRLATDLGLEPGDRIVALEREIASGGPSGGPEPDTMPGARGYRLAERIGEGSFAVVYRGTQPSVDRQVAIKVIRQELTNRPEFIRRFESEAHIVARLEHPHIVPLYDYWREPGVAWLVMRLFPDGTLEDRLADGRLSLDETVRTVNQIAAALQAAHRAGVVHRDVKPANIFLDSEANAFLGDFGIAYEPALPDPVAGSKSTGSPGYAAPEQLRREPVGPATDIHGLAITVFECLTGHWPFSDSATEAALLHRQLNDPLPSIAPLHPEIPEAVDAVLRRATAKLPVERHPTVADFAAEFTAAATGRTVGPRSAGVGRATAIGEFRNPYKGLLAFQEADSADFFGRARLVDRIAERLRGNDAGARFVALVGPSGAGKSSVVRAGLLPSLRQGAVAGSANWFVTTMLPGPEPFQELEGALARIAGAPVDGLAELMASDRRGIGRAVNRILPDDVGDLLLVIDQFEEIFTLCTDDGVCQRFLAGLTAAITDPRSRVRAVVTMRADFYDRPLRIPELAAVFEQATIVLTPLAPDELEGAITEPTARVGATFEPGLVARIVADVVDQPGALPLLQYALTELFDRNVSGLLTKAAYEELGGISGALSRRAERLFVESPASSQELTRRMFVRMVTPGEGTADARRRVARAELGDDAEVDGLIRRYGEARLLLFDRDAASRAPTVEVAHEALLREWVRLRGWLDDDRDGLRLHRHLTTAAAAWEASRRDAGELYRGGRLESVMSWATTHASEMNRREQEFLAASDQAHRDEIAADQRSRRRLRRVLAAVAAVAVVAVIAGALAFGAQRRAESARRAADRAALDAETQRNAAQVAATEAETQRNAAQVAATEADAQRLAAKEAADDSDTGRMAAVAPGLIATNPSLALLVAAEAHQRRADVRTQGALQRVLFSMGPILGFARTDLAVEHVGFNTAGDIVAVVRPHTVRILDGDTMAVTSTFEIPDDLIPQTGSMLSPVSIDGDLMTWVGASGDVWIVTTSTGDIRRLEGADQVSGAAIHARSGNVVVVGDDGEVSLFESLEATAPAWTVEGDGWRNIRDQAADVGVADLVTPGGNDAATTPVTSAAAFSPAGDIVYVSRGVGVRAYATATGAPAGEASWVTRWSVNGQQIVPLGDGSGRVVVMDYYDLGIVDPATGAVTAFDIAEYAPSGIDVLLLLAVTADHRIVVGRSSGFVAVVTTDNTLDVAPIRTQVGRNKAVAVARDGTLLLAGELGLTRISADGRTLVGDAIDVVPGSTGLAAAHQGTEFSVQRFDANGRIDSHATVSCNALCTTGSSTDPAWLRYYTEPHGDLVYETLLVDDTRLRIIDPSDGDRVLRELKVRPATFHVFVPEHRRWAAVTAFLEPVVDVFDLATGELIATVPKTGFVWTNGPPDGSYLLMLDPSGVATYVDTATWVIKDSPMSEGLWLDAGFSRDGRLALTLGVDGQIILRDARTLEPIRTFSGSVAPGLPWTVFSDDAAHALISADGQARLWDVATGLPIGDPVTRPDASPWAIAVAGTDLTMGLLTDDELVVSRFDLGAWPHLACRAAGRNMTTEEWAQYGPADTAYHTTCPQWPSGER